MKNIKNLSNRSSSYKQPYEDIVRKLSKGNIIFSDDMVIRGTDSTFGEPIWSFYQPDNPRMSNRAQNEMHWWQYLENGKELVEEKYEIDSRQHVLKEYILPPAILEDLKRFFVMDNGYTQLISAETGEVPGRRGSRNKLPSSVITTLKASIRFLCFIISEEKKAYNYIETLSDIKLSHVSKYGPTHSHEFSYFHKTFFQRMSAPTVKANLMNPVAFTLPDIKQLPWKDIIRKNKLFRKNNGLLKRPVQEIDSGEFVALHPEMFVWLSEHCRALVQDMLVTVGIKPKDTDYNAASLEMKEHGYLYSYSEPRYRQKLQELKKQLSKVVGQKGVERSKAIAKAKWAVRTSELQEMRDSGEISLDEYRELRRKQTSYGAEYFAKVYEAIEMSRLAAMHLIMQYTGMRVSDARTVRKINNKSCITDFHGFAVIQATKVKGEAKNAPLDQDIWPAPPIVEDAIRLLEHFTFINGNPYLFSSSNVIGNSAYRAGPLQLAFFRLIAHLDHEQRFVIETTHYGPESIIHDHEILQRKYKWVKDDIPHHPHRLRHSLVAELARAECDMPLITLQLKHVHSTYRQFSKVTVGYGGQFKSVRGKVKGVVNPQLMNEIQGKVASVKQEIYDAYFSPERSFAGGGGEAHKNKLKEFFDGKAWSNEEIDTYIKQLSNSGAPLTVCGFGYCAKRTIKGKEAEICKGDLCDPSCNNHVLTEASIPKIERRFKNCIRNLSKTSQLIFHPKWESDKNTYAEYLKKLGVDPSSIEQEAMAGNGVETHEQ